MIQTSLSATIVVTPAIASVLPAPALQLRVAQSKAKVEFATRYQHYFILVVFTLWSIGILTWMTTENMVLELQSTSVFENFAAAVLASSALLQSRARGMFAGRFRLQGRWRMVRACRSTSFLCLYRRPEQHTHITGLYRAKRYPPLPPENRPYHECRYGRR